MNMSQLFFRQALVLSGVFALLLGGSCQKETGSTGSTEPTSTAVVTSSAPTKPSPPPAQPSAAPAKPAEPATASPAPPPPAAPALSSGEREEEATVLKVRQLRGGRTVIGSSGVQRQRSAPSYEVQVGLADGTRISFYPLQNKLKQGNKVIVHYLMKAAQVTQPMLTVATPVDEGRIIAEILPRLEHSPVGDGTFSITFPAAPVEEKTDLGTLYRYEYKFSKSYRPDTFYFFRTPAEGKGNQPFFKEQALSLLALSGGKSAAVRIGGPRRDRKTGLLTAAGAFTVKFGYIPQDGRIQLWYDAKNKILYGAWVHAYSPNRLAAEPEMKRAFFGSFSVK